uniref:Uncharacterized protein n=1 Tax=Phytophthora fragariae TaxID=53985 RepID=A0A6A3EFU8_9STRA|nr:hypothetical protein PF009_g17613 [Phytophthora fragariae]
MHRRISMPFFLSTITIGEAHGLSENATRSAFSSPLSSSYNFWRCRNAIRRARCLMGACPCTSMSQTTPYAGGGNALPLAIMIFSCCLSTAISFLCRSSDNSGFLTFGAV